MPYLKRVNIYNEPIIEEPTLSGRVYKMNRIQEKGITDYGIDWGYGANTFPKIQFENDKYLIARIPSHQSWSGRGETTSYRPYFMLFIKRGKENDRELMQCIAEIKYDRNFKKVALSKITEFMNNYKGE